MTKQEWLTIQDPCKLVNHLRHVGDARRHRLLAAAAVQKVESLLSSDICRRAYEMVLRLPDERIPDDEQLSLRQEVWRYIRAHAGSRLRPSVNADAAVSKALHPLPDEAARMAIWDTVKALARQESDDWQVWERMLGQAQARILPLIHDVFGNPFRSVTVNPAWLTSTVVSLATAIYDERAFDRLPILADALEDAGCDNADMLSHCRQPGDHVRGCWVVDLVLGKS